MNACLIPEPVKEDLKFIVGSMGGDLWTLINNLKGRPELYIRGENLLSINASNCVDYVHWTTSGSIDLPETFRSLYFSGIFTRTLTTFMTLTTYCLEDCLKDLWTKLPNPEKLMNMLTMPTLADPIDVMINVYWMARMTDHFQSWIIAIFDSLPDPIYDEDCSFDENMFMNTFMHSRYLAVMHFWGLMDENQRMRSLEKICEMIIADDDRKWGPDGPLAIFTLQQLMHYGLEDIRIRIIGFEDFLAKLLEWPNDDFFMKTLRESLNHHIMNYKMIMGTIVMNIQQCKRRQLIDRDVKYRKLFYTLWRMNPPNLKSCSDYICMSLWKANEIHLLNHILRDPELKHRRSYFLNKLVESLRNYRVTRIFFKRFVAQVLVDGEEWFAEAFPKMQRAIPYEK